MSRGRHEQSAVIVVRPIEPARGPADDLVPVPGHPPFQPGVTRVLLRGRPYAGPVRAPVSADADQVQGLHALAGPGRGVVLEQHEAAPVPANLFARVLDGHNAHLTDGVELVLGRRPCDFADSAHDTAATGVWSPAAAGGLR